MSLKTIENSIDHIQPGEVWLVGAGPGDIGLLTLHALNAIQHADCLVHDELVNTEIFKLVKTNCEIIYSGKRGGKPSAQQQDISLKLIELAGQNKRVVRLKGGDPFVFGRGGEEALTLVEHNIPFKIVPGVTSGVAGPAYAGIPITHRQHNSVVSFITGHHAIDSSSCRINWKALAKTGGMLVFYMTLNRINQVAIQLLKAGLEQNTSVALISNATTNKQTVIKTRLGDCVNLDNHNDIAKPCLIVIGSNVDFHKQLTWFKPKPV